MEENQEVNGQENVDIETEAEKILELGISMFNQFGYPTSAAFFYSPSGIFAIDGFDFNYKSNPNGAELLRQAADKSEATMVITLSCAKFHDFNKPSRGKSYSTKKVIFVYAEDKNTNYAIAQEFKVGKNGAIRLGKKTSFPKGESCGRTTGFVNEKLRLENERRTNS